MEMKPSTCARTAPRARKRPTSYAALEISAAAGERRRGSRDENLRSAGRLMRALVKRLAPRRRTLDAATLSLPRAAKLPSNRAERVPKLLIANLIWFVSNALFTLEFMRSLSAARVNTCAAFREKKKSKTHIITVCATTIYMSSSFSDIYCHLICPFFNCSSNVISKIFCWSVPFKNFPKGHWPDNHLISLIIEIWNNMCKYKKNTRVRSEK